MIDYNNLRLRPVPYRPLTEHKRYKTQKPFYNDKEGNFIEVQGKLFAIFC